MSQKTAPLLPLLVLLLLGSAGPAAAQKHRLSATDLDRALPIIRLKAQEVRGVVELRERTELEMEAALGASRAGGVEEDPLERIRGRAPEAVAPPGARYDSACSRRTGSAVFIVGRGEVLPALDGDAVLSGRAAEVYAAIAAPLKSQGQTDAEIRQTAQAHAMLEIIKEGRKLLKPAEEFYLGRGYHTGSMSHNLYLKARPGLVVVLNDQRFTAEHCPHLGPSVTVQLLYDETLATAGGFSAALDELSKQREGEGSPAAIARSGWSQEEWERVFDSILNAWLYHTNPANLDVLEQVSPEEARLQRDNLRVFRPRAAEFEPLFEALMSG